MERSSWSSCCLLLSALKPPSSQLECMAQLPTGPAFATNHAQKTSSRVEQIHPVFHRWAKASSASGGLLHTGCVHSMGNPLAALLVAPISKLIAMQVDETNKINKETVKWSGCSHQLGHPIFFLAVAICSHFVIQVVGFVSPQCFPKDLNPKPKMQQWKKTEDTRSSTIVKPCKSHYTYQDGQTLTVEFRA